MPSACPPSFPVLLTPVAESTGFDALFGSSRGSASGKLDTYTVTIQFDDKPKSHFSGQVQLQMPTDTPESRRQAWSLTIQMFITIVIFLLTSIFNPGGWSGLTLAMLVGSILYAWAVFATWRLVYQGNSLQTISQSGWISESELLIEVAGSASRCPITCFQIQPVTDQGVIWFVGEVGKIAITKEIFASSDDWQRLMDWFGK